MSKVYLTHRDSFSASHRCFHPQWSKEKNIDCFGREYNEHGHNFEIEVTVTGKKDEQTGMVINLNSISEVMEEVIEALDHKNLNVDVTYFQNIPPTPENITVAIWKWMEEKINKRWKNKITLFRVRLTAGMDIIEYYGEKDLSNSKI